MGDFALLLQSDIKEAEYHVFIDSGHSTQATFVLQLQDIRAVLGACQTRFQGRVLNIERFIIRIKHHFLLRSKILAQFEDFPVHHIDTDADNWAQLLRP